MSNSPSSAPESPKESLETLQIDGWIIDNDEEEPDFGELQSGDMIGLINIVDEKGIIQNVLYKKLSPGEKVEASTNRIKREYYIYVGKNFIRWGTPNREKSK